MMRFSRVVSCLSIAACSVWTAAFAQNALPIPGFDFVSGAYVPAEPYREGQPKVTGLQLPFPEMPSLDSNPMTPEKVELGKLLYFDPVLSGPNALSCATCHHPDHGFADARQLSMGVGGRGTGPDRSGGAVLKRHAPTVWNAAYNHLQFWDGRAADLEAQAGNPITDRNEMSQDPDELVRELLAIPEYVERFTQVFGGTSNEAVTFDHVKMAIACFERTLVSFNSRFDRYTQGDASALTEQEKRGLRLFRSVKTRCFECHRFPHFADDTFRVAGVPPLEGQEPDRGRADVEGQGPAFAFKVPTLRNIELTAPYMHNGAFATLEEVVQFYADGGGRQFPNPVPGIDDKIGQFSLTEQEKTDLVAFLKSLTDTSLQPEPPAAVPSGMAVVTVLSRAMAPIPPFDPGTRVALASADAQLTRAPLSEPGAATLTAGATITVRPGQSIQTAVDRAMPGDRVEVYPGVYYEQVGVERSGITLAGIEVDGERPVFDGKGEMADAVQVSGSDFTIENFDIRNYQGNGVVASKTSNVTFRDLTIDNAGLYGVYPVECQGVLVEGCVVSRISDAGIYVGQSRDIVVRNNEAFHNVAGIEIENCVNALVANNSAHHNTGGILVFVLPNNPSKVGENCRVINNRIWANNHPNFGKPGSTVSFIPPGTGMIVMAADRTEVTRNWIADNQTYGIAVVNLQTGNPGLDLGHDLDIEPHADHTSIHKNTYNNNGFQVAPAYAAVGAPGGDLFWDGSGEGNTWLEAADVKSFPEKLPRPDTVQGG
ncbi:MAG: right-handed parallel beta-helix repeat-containing protein [Candidatus Hydrogenedentes bacterium]|nr:right-handed parallel beta-helix repeat-containing protein [Candidatus Hydrogenedentota bacterium]